VLRRQVFSRAVAFSGEVDDRSSLGRWPSPGRRAAAFSEAAAGAKSGAPAG
jgi:hypothetical protein